MARRVVTLAFIRTWYQRRAGRGINPKSYSSRIDPGRLALPGSIEVPLPSKLAVPSPDRAPQRAA
jgi:hypothetical protein